MPAPILRHNNVLTGAANTWQNVTGLVPANRALVISKLIVANSSTASLTFYVSLSPVQPVDARAYIAGMVALSSDQVYTETGMVLLAGNGVWFQCSGTAGQLNVNVFGEEVDN